ncbi:MAG: flagellar biosynthesis protein FlhA [Chloroflexi bacterium]|nr:flagellar biosynthesis protein FlhA [Chloroflexota bacterium]
MAVNSKAQPASSGLGRLMQHSDILLAGAVVTIVGMMIIPLPEILLDILITINIATALTILLVSMYIMEPLQFSVFPSLLLIVTLFRLGLNVSATRLILLHASAGQVIASFGNFVVGGNYVVGIVVFMILVVIQFVVITNGAGRVAEVAARFTLDAMPGKQMSIDADLNAGLITEKDARRRRRAIEQEADFYGAMDGASKFVKGDAIAGIVIIVINIIGGFVIGVLQLNMDIMKALQTYTLLTVGDGLVSQIPALLISTATGIIVTRAASESNLGRDVARQILANPRALAIVAALLFGLGMLPGLPKIPFFIIGATLGVVSFLLRREIHNGKAIEEETSIAEQARGKEVENVNQLLQVDAMELEIGYGLIPLVDAEIGGTLLNRISLIRRQMAIELGMILPTVRIRDNLQLSPNSYIIKLRGVQVAKGEVLLDHLLAMNPGLVEGEIDGVPTTEPAFGLPALWIPEQQKEKAELLGYTVVDPDSVITTHLTEVIRKNSAGLLGRQDVQSLINNLKTEFPAVVDELVPSLMSIGEIQKVLQNLLAERISIRDMVAILETLATYARNTKDADLLTEHVRHALGRSITSQYAESDGSLHVFTLSPRAEQLVAGSLQQTDQGVVAVLSPILMQSLLQGISQEMERMAGAGHQPLLVCSARIRLPLKRLLERALPNLTVLSYGEIDTQTEVHSGGVVNIDDDSEEV